MEKDAWFLGDMVEMFKGYDLNFFSNGLAVLLECVCVCVCVCAGEHVHTCTSEKGKTSMAKCYPLVSLSEGYVDVPCNRLQYFCSFDIFGGKSGDKKNIMICFVCFRMKRTE